MSKPPPLPADVLARVLRLARFDGWGLVIVAGGFGLLSAIFGDIVGTIVGGAAAGAGAIELRGSRLLQRGQQVAVKWLVASQLVLMATILTYALYCAFTYNEAWIRVRITQYGSMLADLGIPADQFATMARQAVVLVYSTLAVVTIGYQGGMVIYYHRKSRQLRALQIVR